MLTSPVLFQNKALDVDGTKVKLQVRWRPVGARDTWWWWGACGLTLPVRRSGTLPARSASAASLTPTTETPMVSPGTGVQLRGVGDQELVAWG